jgi:hypothetical protein
LASTPALVVALAVFLGLLVGRRPGEGLLIGWAFGIGLLGLGVFWIRISLDEFGNMGTWLAHALTLLFILVMALYHGLLGGLIGLAVPLAPGLDPQPGPIPNRWPQRSPSDWASSPPGLSRPLGPAGMAAGLVPDRISLAQRRRLPG